MWEGKKEKGKGKTARALTASARRHCLRSQHDNAHEHLQGSMYTTPVLAIVGVGALSQRKCQQLDGGLLRPASRPGRHQPTDGRGASKAIKGRQTRVDHTAAPDHTPPLPPPRRPPPDHHGRRAGLYDSWPYQRPVIFTSLGALEPRSVSDGWMDSNTPAISLLSLSTCQEACHRLSA